MSMSWFWGTGPVYTWSGGTMRCRWMAELVVYVVPWEPLAVEVDGTSRSYSPMRELTASRVSWCRMPGYLEGVRVRPQAVQHLVPGPGPPAAAGRGHDGRGVPGRLRGDAQALDAAEAAVRAERPPQGRLPP